MEIIKGIDMEMKVEIISKGTIKPSSPTPNHLKIHKFSIFDHLTPKHHVQVLLFFSTSGQSSNEITRHLKTSLAKTLTIFYPFAGRVRNNSYVICSDDGAAFTEALAEWEMSKVMRQAEIKQLQQLLLRVSSDEELLVIQINHFRGGGMAIGVSLNHKLGDVSSLAAFLKTWATITRGREASYHMDNFTFDFTSLFPQSEAPDFSPWIISCKNSETIVTKQDKTESKVTKRLVFEASKIAALRQRIGSSGRYPTRYEALGALIWGAYMASANKRDDTITDHFSLSSVDLRMSLNTSSAKKYIGNLIMWASACAAHESSSNGKNYNELASRLGESVMKMRDGGEALDIYLNKFKRIADEIGRLRRNNKSHRIFIISWLSFPSYEKGFDFGWGKPAWTASPITPDNGVFFITAADGKGMEAWVGLPKTDMDNFLQNPDLLSYASIFQNLSRM